MQVSQTPPEELSAEPPASGDSRLSRLAAIGGLLLALWVLAQAAFGQGSASAPPRRRIEHFVLPAAEGGMPPRALARWTRIAVAPGRWLIHREQRHPALGWSFHDVEEIGPGQRRLVHRELGPRRGYSLWAEWNPLAVEPLASSDARADRASAPVAGLSATALAAAAPRLAPGRGQAVHSGSGQRLEQRFEAGPDLLGPLLALEQQRSGGRGVRSIRCLLPESGQPETLTEISAGPGGRAGLRWVEWRRDDGSLRLRAWFLGQELLAFGSEAGGPLFQRVSAQRFAQLEQDLR